MIIPLHVTESRKFKTSYDDDIIAIAIKTLQQANQKRSLDRNVNKKKRKYLVN